MKSAVARWAVACLVVGVPVGLLVRDQTHHARISGKETCLTVDALATGNGVLQADVDLSHVGGPRAAKLGFTFVFPNGQTSTATAHRVSSGSTSRSLNLDGRQRARYNLTATVTDPAGPNPKELVVTFDDDNFPNFMSGSALHRIYPGPLKPCTSSQLQ